MRKALLAGAALVAAVAGCSKSATEPAAATPEMEAQQKHEEEQVRDAEVVNQKAARARGQTSTPADGELEERAERDRRQTQGK